jgi:GTP:adenosylcobinamide-phosphate guanylyltransferase
MDCIVAAGGTPEIKDPLYADTQGRSKALLEVSGKPMLQWVLDALEGAACVDRIVVVGLGPTSPITCHKVIAQLPDQGSLLENAIIGAERLQVSLENQHILFCTCDIPTITPAIVDAFVARCTDPSVKIYYSAIPRRLMEKRFPGSGRSYVHFTDQDLAGGDLHVFAPHLYQTHRQLCDDLINSRKSALKQALRLGPTFFIKLFLRRLSIAELEQRVRQKWGIHARALIFEHPEIGMDVDKPLQLEICRQRLAEENPWNAGST